MKAKYFTDGSKFVLVDLGAKRISVSTVSKDDHFSLKRGIEIAMSRMVCELEHPDMAYYAMQVYAVKPKEIVSGSFKYDRNNFNTVKKVWDWVDYGDLLGKEDYEWWEVIYAYAYLIRVTISQTPGKPLSKFHRLLRWLKKISS